MIIIPANSTSSAFEVANSCMFNSADSAYLSRTPSSAGNRRTYTGSVWVKRSKLDTFNFIFDSDNGTAQSQNLLFGFVNQTLVSSSIYNQGTGATVSDVPTSAVFRDTSAWLHLCVAVDTTQSTASDRIKVYVNGTQITSFGSTTYMTQNYETGINATCPHSIGRWQDDGSRHFDGYLAEFVFIDGTALDPTSFGEFDEDSPTIWKPKAISGLTFGTNGFYLDFKDSSALGNDVSGNNNDFTSNNLAATDSSTDTPTNNFCTMSPLWNFASNVTLSEGNCKIVSSGSWSSAGATIGLTAGKWYYEVKMTTLPGGGGNGRIGFFDSEVTHTSGRIFEQTNGATYFYNNDGGETQIDNSVTTADYGEVAQGGILGVALNMDDKQVTFYDDNVAIITNLALSTNGTSGIVIPSSAIHTETQEYNFGNPPYSLTSAASDENGYGNFEFAPPSGYLAICSKNLGSDGG
tara:strand:- start:24 stop:1412 length:1389 start_codon:yes stop_codon:yes gene_type:complete